MMAPGRNMSLALTVATQARRSFSRHFDKFSLSGEMRMGGEENAYEVLGVSPTCSEEIIRKAFRELAKATHPDMQTGLPHPSSSARFIVVLSAYRVLSNPQRREQYDAYLEDCSKSQSKLHCGNKRSPLCQQGPVIQEMEVAEWLRWYRDIITDVISEHQIGVSKNLQEELRENLQAALKRAYFGPFSHELDGLPDCFETEERASSTELDVLHLVSGRTLFGAVRQISGMELLREAIPKCLSLGGNSGIPICREDSSIGFINGADSALQDKATTIGDSEHHSEAMPNVLEDYDQRAFVDLELYLFGNLIARATRAHCKSTAAAVSQTDRLDKITVYLCSDQPSWGQKLSKTVEPEKRFQGVLLGTILGLSATDFGAKSRVYSPDGKHTHIIWQFRTPLV